MPEVTVILPTDTFATIQAVLDRLAQITMAGLIDVLLVSPEPDEIVGELGAYASFASIRVIETPTLAPLGIARAIGVRAAETRYIFVGETHSFLYPDALEKLLAEAKAGGWAAVVPGFQNANPQSSNSWAAFFVGYSRWSAVLPEGEIKEAPLYDAIYQREMLLACGDQLELMLSGSNALTQRMESKGLRVKFAPDAQIEHINIERLSAWLHEHYLLGKFIGAKREETLPWSRRLIYILGAPLIPFILLRRSWSGIRAIQRRESFPKMAYAGIFCLYVAKAFGEAVGCMNGMNREEELDMNLYEIRRLDFLYSVGRS